MNYANKLVPGALYIVSTPIGNLEDITYRAVRILKEADLIACEDTRHTRKLLDHYGIQTRAISYHEHNESARAADLLERLRDGQSIALVSDAGTPLISDPGYRVVAQAAAEGVPVIPIPGPSAAIAALSASGLPTDSFRFCGFLPAKSSQRRRLLESVAADSATLIFYEAPHRIVESLAEMREVLGPRPAVVARELTKLHEEILRGTLDDLASSVTGRGEFTIVVGKGEPAPESDEPIVEAVKRLERAGVPRMEAMKTIARERGVSKRDVYRAMEDDR